MLKICIYQGKAPYFQDQVSDEKFPVTFWSAKNREDPEKGPVPQMRDFSSVNNAAVTSARGRNNNPDPITFPAGYKKPVRDPLSCIFGLTGLKTGIRRNFPARDEQPECSPDARTGTRSQNSRKRDPAGYPAGAQ